MSHTICYPELQLKISELTEYLYYCLNITGQEARRKAAHRRRGARHGGKRRRSCQAAAAAARKVLLLARQRKSSALTVACTAKEYEGQLGRKRQADQGKRVWEVRLPVGRCSRRIEASPGRSEAFIAACVPRRTETREDAEFGLSSQTICGLLFHGNCPGKRYAEL